MFKNYNKCYDTAHIFGAGFSIKELIETVDDKPTLIHLNGTTKNFGSKTDEHIPMCSELD